MADTSSASISYSPAAQDLSDEGITLNRDTNFTQKHTAKLSLSSQSPSYFNFIHNNHHLFFFFRGERGDTTRTLICSSPVQILSFFLLYLLCKLFSLQRIYFGYIILSIRLFLTSSNNAKVAKFFILLFISYYLFCCCPKRELSIFWINVSQSANQRILKRISKSRMWENNVSSTIISPPQENEKWL